MNALKAMAVLPTIFVQFRDPATDAKLFVQKEQVNENTGETAMVNDLSKPIGVRVYSRGAKQYRAAEAKLATEGIQRGRKGINGNTIIDNQTKLLALTTTEYVNFDVDGQGASYETNYELYADPQYVAVRDLVEAAQNDLGNASPNTTSN